MSVRKRVRVGQFVDLRESVFVLRFFKFDDSFAEKI